MTHLRPIRVGKRSAELRIETLKPAWASKAWLIGHYRRSGWIDA
jgi:hypothetical protein